MQLRLSEHDEDRPYDALTLNDKIGMVREEAFTRATDARNGHAKLYYKDVMYGVFDGHPGNNHTYKLMRLAGQADGFTYREDPPTDDRHLHVDASRAKRSYAYSPRNNEARGGVE